MPNKKLDLLQLDNPPKWITQENIDYLKKPDFQMIVRFFVISTPDKETCARGKEISEYGYEEDKLFDDLIGEIPYLKKGNLEISDLKSIELFDFPPSVPEEKICFTTNTDKPVTSLFIHIRNSLAHGRFNFGGSKKMPYLIMEDMNKPGNCNARMILKFATLKSWIKKMEG